VGVLEVALMIPRDETTVGPPHDRQPTSGPLMPRTRLFGRGFHLPKHSGSASPRSSRADGSRPQPDGAGIDPRADVTEVGKVHTETHCCAPPPAGLSMSALAPRPLPSSQPSPKHALGHRRVSVCRTSQPASSDPETGCAEAACPTRCTVRMRDDAMPRRLVT
jgi:hypothetical protein